MLPGSYDPGRCSCSPDDHVHFLAVLPAIEQYHVTVPDTGTESRPRRITKRGEVTRAHIIDCAADLMYRHGGSTSFKRESRPAECWRDLHVVGQTVTIAPEWYPLGGRVYLGMDPGPRLR